LSKIELYDLNSSSDIIHVIRSRRKRWVGNAVRVGDRRGQKLGLMGKREGKKSLGRNRCRRGGEYKNGFSRSGMRRYEQD